MTSFDVHGGILMSNTMEVLFSDKCKKIHFDVPNIESFDVMFSMFGALKFLCLVISVIETHDQFKED